MSNTKRKLLVFLFPLLVLSLSITDMLGRKVDVPENPRRILCIGPGALRLITYLRAQTRVVAVEEIEKTHPEGRPYTLANPFFARLPVFARGGPPGKNPINEEIIISLSPQVIFVTYMERDGVERLQARLKIPVVLLSYGALTTFEDELLFRSLLLAGKILNKSERARELIDFIKRVKQDLKRRIKGIPAEKKPSVYVGGLGYKGAHGIDSTMAKFPTFLLLKAKNVVDSLRIEGWIAIDREKLLEWNPDIIFIDEGGLKLILEDVKKNPSFYRALKAVKENRVYGLLPFNYYTTNVEVALANAYFVGKTIYPGRFEDIDPEEKADEIFNFFVGKALYRKMKKDCGGYIQLKLFR